MGLREQYATDPVVEKQGVWFSITGDDDEEICAFRVARAGGKNTKYSKKLDNLMKPYRRAIQRDQMPMAKMQNLIRQAFVSACMVKWRGSIQIEEIAVDDAGNPVEDENGKVQIKLVEVGDKFSARNAEKLLEQLPELAEELAQFAASPAAFKLDIQECESEN